MPGHDDNWRWKPGDLVQLVFRMSPSHPMYSQKKAELASEVGVVLRYYDSNVYEPASVDVLINGQELHMSTRDLIRVKEKE